MKKRISFDFDGTLDRENVFNAAKECVKLGVEIWIVTSRFTEQELRRNSLYFNNYDLYDIAEQLEIPDERIVFTNMRSKSIFFARSDKKFDAHLDNDHIELEDIIDLNNNDRYDKYIEPIYVDEPCWNEKLLSIL